MWPCTKIWFCWCTLKQSPTWLHVDWLQRTVGQFCFHDFVTSQNFVPPWYVPLHSIASFLSYRMSLPTCATHESTPLLFAMIDVLSCKRFEGITHLQALRHVCHRLVVVWWLLVLLVIPYSNMLFLVDSQFPDSLTPMSHRTSLSVLLYKPPKLHFYQFSSRLSMRSHTSGFE